MFEKIRLSLRKRSMHRRIRKAKKLIKKSAFGHAEKLYIGLIKDYKDFCKKGSYLEKLSIYHNLLYLYKELTKDGESEERPEAVKRTARKKEAMKKAHEGKTAGHEEKDDEGKPTGKEKPTTPAMPAAEEEEAKKEKKKDEQIGVVQQPPHHMPSKMNFTTAIDELYSYIQNRGNATIMDASLKFKVSRDKIEEWAKILEEHNLIKLHYPAFTSPQMMSIEWMDKEEEKRRKKAEEKKRKKHAKKKLHEKKD